MYYLEIMMNKNTLNEMVTIPTRPRIMWMLGNKVAPYYWVTNPKFLAGAKLIHEALLEDLGIEALLAGQVYEVSSKNG